MKHNVSFMSRERELIGKVYYCISNTYIVLSWSLLYLILYCHNVHSQLQLDLDQIDLMTGVTQWYLFQPQLNNSMYRSILSLKTKYCIVYFSRYDLVAETN